MQPRRHEDTKKKINKSDPRYNPTMKSATQSVGALSETSENAIETLRALNDEYIHSVATCDVARFREILADDFLCSGPDGVLLDKRAFLDRTSGPRTLQHLTADDVRIRILGDVAIIHAATQFTTIDGREGRGRYTDIWAQRGGRWLAVAAHVTRL
jgi:ketosteroid isomerase-like protein